MELLPGDSAVVQTKDLFGELIRDAESIIGKTGIYNHAFTVVDSSGKILEANWHFGYNNISEYIGCKMFIVRFHAMTPDAFAKGWNVISKDIGNIYPWYRLPLFLIGLDKYLKGGQGVCSEEVNKQLLASGIQCNVWGETPDDLAVEWFKEVSDGNADIILNDVESIKTLLSSRKFIKVGHNYGKKTHAIVV